MNTPTAIILMGVSGCGKSSTGAALSARLGWPFLDGDDFHPQENVAKMAAGHPLDDNDRAPWLAALHNLIHTHLQAGQSLLLACSALKEKYRVQLSSDNAGTQFVYLKGDFDLIYGRMLTRADHYMQAEMLQSQFNTLEEPTNAIVININQSMEKIVQGIIKKISD